MHGRGTEGEGDDHNNGSNVSPPNDDNDGAEEEEATVNIAKDKGEDFAMGSMPTRWDNTATMMDAPPCHHLRIVLFLSRDCRSSVTTKWQAQRMQWHPQATTVAKDGIVDHTTASSGAITNNIDDVAWRQSRTNINNTNDDNYQCW
jgi:hypothetical protein